MKIWKCKTEDDNQGATPGTVLQAQEGGIFVACGEGTLVLTEVQLEGKKRMETDAFLRGYQVTAGTMLKDHKE